MTLALIVQSYPQIKSPEKPIVQTALVQDSKPIRDQGMTYSINSHSNNKMSENNIGLKRIQLTHIPTVRQVRLTGPKQLFWKIWVSRAILMRSLSTERTRLMRTRLLLNILKTKLSRTILEILASMILLLIFLLP